VAGALGAREISEASWVKLRIADFTVIEQTLKKI
jgi:hypothetical protein